MLKGTGYPVYPGIAVGPVFVYQKQSDFLPISSQGASIEKAKFDAALETAKKQLQQLFLKAKEELGEEQAMIIDVQMMILDDLDFLESVESMIQNGASAAKAVLDSGELFCSAFSSMDDEYMKARAIDIKDVSQRIVKILCGDDSSVSITRPCILVAEDLTPSQTVQLPKDKILAFVTKQGSSNSHTAILARTMNIPSLVQADISLDNIHGKQIIVDGFHGVYYLEPDEQTFSLMKEQQNKASQKVQQLETYRGKASITKAGRKINLFANIGNPEDVELALAGDAEGIGLLRSEFLYLGGNSFPSEDELFTAYRKVVEKMKGRRVVIRTLDIGADKKADYFGLEAEENPALGYRGIRICLMQEEIFRPQMRAVYRAAAYGNVSVMFPMITSLWEVQQIKKFCTQIKKELQAENIPWGEIELGIMIETPAAALISEQLAKEVDFFSVGTNDLTQYTLAVDRQNNKLNRFYDPHHPAVLTLLAMIAKNAHKAGIWVGICGELGADTSLTEDFIQMGFDELSVSPGRILELRKIICESEVSPNERI